MADKLQCASCGGTDPAKIGRFDYQCRNCGSRFRFVDEEAVRSAAAHSAAQTTHCNTCGKMEKLVVCFFCSAAACAKHRTDSEKYSLTVCKKCEKEEVAGRFLSAVTRERQGETATRDLAKTLMDLETAMREEGVGDLESKRNRWLLAHSAIGIPVMLICFMFGKWQTFLLGIGLLVLLTPVGFAIGHFRFERKREELLTSCHEESSNAYSDRIAQLKAVQKQTKRDLLAARAECHDLLAMHLD